MTKRIPTGGPAFPVECNIVNGFRDDTGMTLRDWFAGQSLNGVIVQCASDSDAARYSGGPSQYFAMQAYKLADAMLAEKFKADEINAKAQREIEDDPF